MGGPNRIGKELMTAVWDVLGKHRILETISYNEFKCLQFQRTKGRWKEIKI